MPAMLWTLWHDRPMVEVTAASVYDGPERVCRLIADTGAGSRNSVFELVLQEQTCISCGGIFMGHIRLGGAYSGRFPLYLVQIRMTKLNFEELVPAAGVPSAPNGFDGIAGFKFLKRFHYGNFSDPEQFGLDVLPPP